jgi:hypothetical protein
MHDDILHDKLYFSKSPFDNPTPGDKSKELATYLFAALESH